MERTKPRRVFLTGDLVPLEVQPRGELQPPHLRVDGHAVNLSSARIGDIAVRKAEVGMVEQVEYFNPESNLGVLADREVFHQRHVLIDETWTIQRVNRVIAEGVVRGHQEGAAQAADEPLPPIAKRAFVWIGVALVRPIRGANVWAN